MMDLKGNHALIIGGSSGLGLAAMKKLAAAGMDITIIHRDRRTILANLKEEIGNLQSSYGVQISSHNIDATNLEKIRTCVDDFKDARFDLFIHAVSRGNLKPFVSESAALTSQDLSLTIEAMGTNLHMWVRELLAKKLIGTGARIITLTSEGNDKFWEGYGAVALAKSTLETLSKYLAVELAPMGITVNIIQAGITDTPSLRLIPDSDTLISTTKRRNPSGRMTTPEDIANAVYLLARPEASWINGALIHVDGGEHLI